MKLVKWMLVAALAAGTLASPVRAQGRLGDVNFDDHVDASDASLILAEYASQSTSQGTTFTDPQQKINADVNGNGVVDAIDASVTLAFYSFLSTGGSGIMEDWLADSASSPAVAPPVSSDGNVVDENAHPDDALNKPVLTVTVDGKEGGRTFLLSEARGRSIDCTVKVSGANAQYGATGLRVHHSDKLLLATNHLGRIAVEPGKAVKQLARSNPVEDPTAPAGMKGFFAATAGKANYGIDGTMWTFSFTLSDDVEPGDVLPIDIVFRASESGWDRFSSIEDNAAGRNMEAYLFTKGIYTAVHTNAFATGADVAACAALAGIAGDADGYIAIADPASVAYPLWVGGVQVCETNKNDILGDGTASFAGAATGGTLVLSNATITATHAFEKDYESLWTDSANVFSGEGFDLAIMLVGTNILENADHPEYQDQGNSYGVRSQGDLAITGDGALVAWVEYNGAGIDTDGNLLIDGAVVTAHSGQDGIRVGGSLAISNAVVTACGGGYDGISGGDGDIVIADSVVTATGWAGIEADGHTVAVSGASVVTAEATWGDESAWALCASALVLGDGLAIAEPAGGAFDADAGYVVDPATGKAALRVVIGTPPPFVTNVVARQRWPWNGLVDVDYEVGGSTTGLVARISFAEQGGEGRAWVASNFLAGAEPSAEPGFHRATWDTKADGATNVVAANVVATVALVRPASCGRLALDFGGLGVRTDAASYRATLYDNAGNPTKDPLTAAIGDAPPPDAVFDDVPSSTRKAVVEFLDEGGNVLCETAVEGDAFPRLPPGGEAVVPVLEGDAVTLRVAHAWPAETETVDVRIVYDDGAEKRVFVEGAGFDAAAGSCEAVFRAAGGAASVKSVTLLRDGVPFEWLDYDSPPASANGALELDVDGNEFANGAYADGTAMQVANPRHLDNVRNHLGGSFKQIQDIDFAGSCGITNAIAVDKSDDGTDIACTRCDLDATVRFYGGADNVYGWTPIGDREASPFSGTYDGNGCRIAGLVGNAVGRRSSVCALFGWAIGTTAKPAVVKNVIIADDCSFAASLSAAPLVGEGGGGLEIAGCETAGDVYGENYAAGVLAEAYRDSGLQLKVSECTVGARIHGQNVAGVMSWCSGGSASLYQCVFGEDGAAIGSWAVGGLVCHAGLNEADSFVIDECHSLGTLSIPSTHDENRTSSHGGFIGYWASECSLTIDGQCEVKARFDFEGSADRIGGVIGYCTREEGVSDDQLKNRMKNIFIAHVSVDSGCLVAFEDRKIGTYAGDPWLDAL